MSSFFFDPAAHAHFQPDRATKATVAMGEVLFLGLNCFEPGQSQPVHRHDGADKFYLLLSGNARMQVGDESREAGPGTLVWAPAGVPHGVLAAHQRTVMLIGIAPPPRAGRAG